MNSQQSSYQLPTETISTGLANAVDDGAEDQLEDLRQLVRIPSVSWPAFDPAQVSRSAQAVAQLLQSTQLFDSVNIETATIPDSATPGHPAVLAVRRAQAGRPTILLYAHHDVQPPGEDDQWDTPPYEPTTIDGRMYARGAADDKAGIMAHVGALRAVAQVLGEDLHLGIAVLVEGEEEYGSRSFPAFLADHRAALESDVIVVADSSNWDQDTPALTASLRGNVTMSLTVRTLAHASHSGMVGGPVPDAFLAMVRLLDSLWDEEGSVAVAGLRAHQGLTPEFAEDRLRHEAGLLPQVTPIGRGPLLARMWHQPAITVTGIDAPDMANASNTLLPQVTVRVSVRVAPGQSPDDALAAFDQHVRDHAPFGASVTIDDVDLGAPFLVDTSGPAVRLALEALTQGYGRQAVQIGVGGSIPFIAQLVEMFPQAEVLVTGVEDPHSRAHSPNESLHLRTLRNATLSEALMMASLNALDDIDATG